MVFAQLYNVINTVEESMAFYNDLKKSTTFVIRNIIWQFKRLTLSKFHDEYPKILFRKFSADTYNLFLYLEIAHLCGYMSEQRGPQIIKKYY